MSDDFRAGIDDLSRGGRGAPPERARSLRRRGRAHRATAVGARHESLAGAAGSVAVVAVLGLTAAALVHRPAPTPPVSTPTPTRSASPSPSDSSTPQPVATSVTLALKESRHRARRLDDRRDVGHRTGVDTHPLLDDDRRRRRCYGHFDPAGTQALFLVAPDGTTYRLVSLRGRRRRPRSCGGTPRNARPGSSSRGWARAGVRSRSICAPATTTAFVLGPSAPADPAPVLQLPDGRVLWVDADPYFPVPARRAVLAAGRRIVLDDHRGDRDRR